MNNSPDNENTRQRKLKAHLTVLSDDVGLVDASITVWFAIFGILGAITVMWFLNITGLQVVNWFIGLAGVLVFAIAAFGPNNVLAAAGLGGVFAFLMDRDKTQGIATGPVWLFKIVNIVSFGFLFSAITLATWSFRASPIAFWAIFICVMALMMWEQHTGKKSKWGEIIVVGYLVLTIVVAVLQSLGGPFTNISNQPTSWVGSLDQLPQMDGQLLNWMPSWVSGWWPLILIVILMFVPHPKAANVYVNLGIAALAAVWLAMTFPNLFDGLKHFGKPGSNPCAVQNVEFVPEKGGLNVTLCPQGLEYKNVVTIQRHGPQDVEISFGKLTKEKYGDILGETDAREFVYAYPYDCPSFEFCIQIAPLSEAWEKYGLHLVPLDFTVTYKKSVVPEE